MPYRFAIVGCGNIAGRHAAAIQCVGSLEAVCDPEITKCQMLVAGSCIPVYSNLEQMLTETRPDVAVICSPSYLHPSHSITSFRFGCHVLCEKPAALNTADAKKIIEAADLAGRLFYVVKQNRFNPPVILLKRLIDEGKLGKLQSFQVNCFWNRNNDYYTEAGWRGKTSESGGTLFTQFSHFIDLICWALGDVEQANGWRSNFQHHDTIDFEDTGIALLKLANGAIGSLHYTINAQPGNVEGSFTVFAEKGTIKIGGAYLNSIEHFAVNDVNLADYELKENPVSNHQLVYNQFIDSLDGKAITAANDSILKTIQAIELIYNSSPMINISA